MINKLPKYKKPEIRMKKLKFNFFFSRRGFRADSLNFNNEVLLAMPCSNGLDCGVCGGGNCVL